MRKAGSFLNNSTSAKYVALQPIRFRLGNQLYHFASGYGIARKLRRKLYYVLPNNKYYKVQYHLEQITETFPKTKTAFEILSHEQINPVSVRLNNRTKWLEICCGFFDTSKLIDHPAKYLVLGLGLAQNLHYFVDYIYELKKLFTFSKSSRAQGESSLKLLNLNNETRTMCVHIRRKDFFGLGLESELRGTLQATQSIAASKGLRQYLIFGDDKNFMASLADALTENSSETPKRTIISTFSELTDFYLSSRVCDAFLLSAVGSTFGWWLAFLAKNQNAIYVYKTGRENEEFRFKNGDFLLKTWHIYNGAPGNYSPMAVAGILVMACTFGAIVCRSVFRTNK